ncbi:transposase [Aquimarina aggregata]|uniref:transposase n=1 Tax=Aquimarina aggregata TaxID=1642818 RepID=UPI002490241D|nr:transposase [Aquimarina aggregata]
MESAGIILKTGAIVDASVIDTPLRPKGKTNHKVTQDREDLEEIEVDKQYVDSVDKEASWLKKQGKYRYGYKKHHVTDNEGLVLGVLTTKASVNEVGNLEEVLDTADLPQNIPIKADKGYKSKKNAALLEECKLKNHILKKAYKNKSLIHWEKKFNKKKNKKVQTTSYSNITTRTTDRGTVEIWFKKLDFPLLLTKQVFKNENDTVGELYLACSDLSLSYEQVTTIYKKRWAVEININL